MIASHRRTWWPTFDESAAGLAHYHVHQCDMATYTRHSWGFKR